MLPAPEGPRCRCLVAAAPSLFSVLTRLLSVSLGPSLSYKDLVLRCRAHPSLV